MAWVPNLLLTLFSLSITHTFASSLPSIYEIYEHFRVNLSPGTQLFLPNYSTYANEITPRWTTFEPPSYTIAVKPSMESDLQKIIRYAAKHRVPFLGTGGGHGYTTTTSMLRNGIDIDLGNFNAVDVDVKSETITIGGSVIFDDVFDPLYNAKKEIQIGYCSCVGVVGATLGGGIGPLQGLHGLVADALISVRIVTANGDALTASESENRDLFWAIRGAGANFGIIVSATYRIFDSTNGGNALAADFLFPASENISVFRAMESYTRKQPDAFSISSAITWSSDLNQSVIQLSTIYYGDMDQGMVYNRPFLNSNPIVQNISVLPWNLLTKQNRFGADAVGCIKGRAHSLYSLNIYSMSIPAYLRVFDSFSSFFLKYPELRNTLFVTEIHPRNAVLRIPDDSTAYPFRNTTAYTFFDFILPDAKSSSTVDEFMQGILRVLGDASGNPDRQTYVNYARGNEGPRAWYTDKKLGRLRTLKKKWDPQGLFSFTNGVNT
ncbi:hypothetical protein GGS24DRAFT_216948 [Hypoxylon argillaceum]|nr:hypothetical protein GGS24DRAFT_216948 [Hypoxylon argillaceum]